MRKLILVFGLLCIGLTLCAQSISGVVLDSQEKPLPYANVVVLSAKDSAFVVGTITDEKGKFRVDKAAVGDILKVSFIGYEPYVTTLNTLDALTIVLKEDAHLMSEVVVKGNVPQHKLTIEGVQTNVENTLLSKLGTCEDVLTHIPGLTKQRNGYEVFGRGAPIIYINGRLMRDGAELERLKSSDIKSVEVITNPGAKYNAAVKAVVKIRTKKVQGDGFGFDVRSSYYQSENVDLSDRLNWNYRHKRLDVFGSHGYTLDNGYYPSTITTVVRTDTLWNQKLEQDTREKAIYFKNTLGADYQLNDSNSIGFKYTVNFRHESPNPNNISSDVTADGVFYDHLNTLSVRKETYKPAHFLNLYYVGKVGKMDVDMNVDYLYNNSHDNTSTHEQSQSRTSRTVTSNHLERNRLFASKLTLGYPLLGGNLSAGAEYTYTNRNDDYINPEHYVPTSYAQLKESNIAPFVEYTHMLPICQLTVGLRWENTRFNYYEDGQHVPSQSRSFSNLFPSISAATQIGNVQLQLAYAAKTRRPSYSQLSNNVSYGNRFLLQSGNPLLKHEYIHTISLGGAWKFIQFGFAYNDRRNAIVFWSNQDRNSSSISRLTFKNLPSIKNVMAKLAFTPKIGIWNPEVSFLMKKQWLNLQTDVQTYKLNKPILKFVFNNTFDFGKGWIFDMESYFVRKGNDEVGSMVSNIGAVDVSLSKSFLKDCLTLRLGGTDLFHTVKDGGTEYTGVMETSQLSTYDSRQLVFTVTYRFNSARSKYKGKGAGNAEKQRL